MTELHDLTLLELTAEMRARRISPVEATQAQLDRIAALDGKLSSYATVMAETALAEARVAEQEIGRGEHRGPLHGAPIAVKDLCWTKAVPTAAGMTVHQDFVPTEDATVVRRLREAGAVILGKLQMTEGAYADHHPSITPPKNPWGAGHWAGSSSSGSGVATAAGLCYGSLGSDTGGSIRFPCAANGLTGIKPTWGRVSRFGIFDLGPTLDHVGPMTRSAADAAAMLDAISGPDPNDPTAALQPGPDALSSVGPGIAGLRIGVDAASHSSVDPDTARALADTLDVLRTLGAQIIEVSVPDSTQVTDDWFPLCAAEVAVVHEATYPSRKAEYGTSLAALIEQGHGVTGMQYQKIALRRLAFTGRVRALFAQIDLLLAPVQSIAAPTLERFATFGQDPALLQDMLKFSCPANMSGNPTITLPGGLTGSGMPVGVQLIAAHWAEAMLARAGAAFQSATDWHRRHPTLPSVTQH